MQDMRNTFTIWNLFLAIARHRVFVVGFVVLATVVALVIALILPKWYRAEASILPSTTDQTLGITGNYMQYSLSSTGFELPLMATPSDVYATMLKSSTIGRRVIEDQKLLDYFKIDSWQKCLRYLNDKMDVKVTHEGIVEVYFADKDPQRAADIANSYIHQLDILNREVKAAKARADKEFIQNRLETTRLRLDSARTKLLEFQSKNKTVDIDKQMEVAIATATDLRSRLAQAEIELDLKRRSFSENHNAVQELRREVTELRNKLNMLETGTSDSSFMGLSLAEFPGLSIRLAELRAEVQLHEKVYSLLTSLFEEARIKEQRDTPTIAVLEKAFPPEFKYRPKRAYIVAGTFIGSLVLALLVVLGADYIENLRARSPGDYALMQQAREALHSRQHKARN